MKRIFLFGLLLAMAGHSAVAQESYFGAGFGQGSVDIISDEVDDESNAFKVFGGFIIDRSADLEIAYVDFGEFSARLDDGVDRLSLKKESSAIALSLLGKLPFSEQSSLFLRGGLYRWELDLSARSDGPTLGTQSETSSDDGVSLLVGLGFEQSFARWGLRAEWERYTDLGTDSTGGKSDLDLIALSVLARF